MIEILPLLFTFSGFCRYNCVELRKNSETRFRKKYFLEKGIDESTISAISHIFIIFVSNNK